MASSGVCLILALGTTTGSVFVVSVTEVGTVVWAALDTDTIKGTVKRCVFTGTRVLSVLPEN